MFPMLVRLFLAGAAAVLVAAGGYFFLGKLLPRSSAAVRAAKRADNPMAFRVIDFLAVGLFLNLVAALLTAAGWAAEVVLRWLP